MRLILLTCLQLSLVVSANLLINGDCEIFDKNTPRGWGAYNFNTGGSPRAADDGGHSGRRYFVLHSDTATQRSSWRQRRPFPADTVCVAVNAFYRNRDTIPQHQRGASFRIHWYSADGKELHLEQRFFPVKDSWTSTGTLYFFPPENASHVELQLFHWLTPGETHWDDAVLTALNPQAITALPREDFQRLTGLDKPPVDLQNLPPAPSDGETVNTNPPPFHWIPPHPNTLCNLQICQSADFTGPTLIEKSKLPWSLEMLTDALAPGRWHWRYGYDHPALGRLWSRTRSFTVPDSARPFPFPKPSQLAIRRQRPRLFFTPETLPAIRRQVADGDLKSYANSLLRNVARHAGEPLVPEPRWLPKDTTRARVYTEIFRATRPPMNLMEDAALAYALTGNPEAGQEARRRVIHFFSWNPDGPTNTFHNDEPAMWIMMRGCRAYDWTFDLYTPTERELIEKSMVTRAKAIYDLLRRNNFDNNPYNSHLGRQIGFLGEACLSLLPEHPEMQPWFEYILKIYWGIYPAWGKEDGGWNEGPHYWGAYMGFGLHFVTALKMATGIDLTQKPFFANTPDYLLYQCPPRSVISPFGDGPQARSMTQPDILYAFGCLLNNPTYKWYATACGFTVPRSLLSVCLRNDDILPQRPKALPQTRHFPGVGLVCSHSSLTEPENDVAFYFRSSPYGAVSHGHNDQNCFALQAYGEPLAIPTGHYNYYGSPHHNDWMRTTKAKCGITYDGGHGQPRSSQSKGRITRFLANDRFALFAGDATAAYNGTFTLALREITRLSNDLFVIRDTLTADSPHACEYWLHATDRMTVDTTARTITTTRPHATLTTTFLAPANLTFSQTDQFTPPPTELYQPSFVNQFHLTATAPAATRTTFITVLHPRRTGDDSPAPEFQLLESPTAQAVVITRPDGSRLIAAFARGNDATHSIAGLSFTTHAAAASLAADGTLLDMLCD